MEKITFAETQGAEPINWFVELNKPDNIIDWDKLKKLASNWVTCACGNQCSIIPRKSMSGKPHDATLSGLGDKFFNTVFDCDRGSAMYILSQIEIRSIELIEEILLESK